jgi:hypothetical protein
MCIMHYKQPLSLVRITVMHCAQCFSLLLITLTLTLNFFLKPGKTMPDLT